MSLLVVVLDTGPLGLVTNPRNTTAAVECRQWLAGLLADGHRVLVPAIADYEVRRELVLYGKRTGLRKMDALRAQIGYLPLTEDALFLTADFWAQARRQGQPTADPKALDGDVILAAQAATFDAGGDSVVVATTNVGHLSRFVPASYWAGITGDTLT
jgi:predicted nucleic acid-binding protein